MFDPQQSGCSSDRRFQERRSVLKSQSMLLGATMLNVKAMGMMSGSRGAQSSSQTANSAGQGLRRGMIGIMLPHEQFPVPDLVQWGAAAEKAGFDLLATSDHLQPWQANEGHSGEAWVTPGALGEQPRRGWLGPPVTCPSFRYNPAGVAEAFASLSLLYPGRIFLGLGSGEALNEQAATREWPDWGEGWARVVA